MKSQTYLAPSQRGQRNIERGMVTDAEADLDGVTLYDPQDNPSGLIAASGASNELMNDWLREYCDNRTSRYDLAKGTRVSRR